MARFVESAVPTRSVPKMHEYMGVLDVLCPCYVPWMDVPRYVHAGTVALPMDGL